MPRSMLAVYDDLQEKLSKATAATEGMTSSRDPALKKYRFDLQKAITMTVNSISANSGEDLRGKISRLQRLIRGDTIDVMGKSLSIRNHPSAKMYCCNLLAKKLVVRENCLTMLCTTTEYPRAFDGDCLWRNLAVLQCN